MISIFRLTMIMILTVACLVLVGFTPGSAEIPRLISYQGRVTTSDGTPVADGNHTVRFDLYLTATSTASQWNETATVITSGGLFTHLLGSVNPMSANRFASDSLFLQITYESQVQSPRTRLISVPYARRVHTISGALGGYVYDDLRVWDSGRSVAFASFYIGGDGEPELYMDGSSRDVWIDLGQSGSQSVQFPSSAIQATEMLDEPGVGSDNNTSIHLAGSPEFLAGRTMTAPVDGYVLVVATAHFTIQHTNGVQSSCILDVSDNISSFVTSTVARLTLPASLPTGLYEFPLASHALFPVSAGSQPYYALGSKSGATSVTVYDVQLTECFFPTAYTTVSPPVPPLGSTSRSSALFDPAAERLEAQAVNNARLQAELDQIKAELEAVKQHLTDVRSGDEPKR